MSVSLSRRMRAVVLLTCLAGIAAGTAQPATAKPTPEEPAAATQPAITEPEAPVKPEAPVQQAAPGRPDVTHQGIPATQPTGSAVPATPVEPSTKPAAKPPRKPAGPAQVVAVVRTGGISGGLSVFTLVGASNRQGAQVLRLASTPEFRALRPRYVPKDTCCDRFSYKVEVGYRNGVKKKITVLADTPGTPRVLLDVIRLMETMPAPRPLVITGFPFN